MKLCPKCKSEDIVQDASILTGQYHCKKCGIITAVVLEKNISIKKHKKTTI